MKNTSSLIYDDHTKPHYDVTIVQLSLFIFWLSIVFVRFMHIFPKPRTFSNIAQVESQTTNHSSSGKEWTEAADSTILLGVILALFYLVDYRKIYPNVDRVYSRDNFLFLIFILLLVAVSATRSETKPLLLNRDQTEEWRGWMQVLFVWYHYFVAKEWYVWIRVYISAYVWMTGFGNFSFFYVKKDYSCMRVIRMLFRLNFLVVCLCAVTKNQYMLYYICAMHSYWFLTVWVAVAIMPEWNDKPKFLLAKMLAYIASNAVVFELSGTSAFIFTPLRPILGFSDGRTNDPMHEWVFRAGLDHWSCLLGAVVAYFHSNIESFLVRLDGNTSKCRLAKLSVVVVLVGVLAAWSSYFPFLEKYTYNRMHPYVSFIPIFCFFMLRNIDPILRSHYLGLFAFLGKITLETYLSQLHIYLQSNAKHNIPVLPGYPMLNFSLVTIIYIVISHRLFIITNAINSFLFVTSLSQTALNVLYLTLALVASTAVAFSISKTYFA